MAIITVLKMGDPRLKQKATEVTEFASVELAQQINDMVDTMRHFCGVGLAAPQIGLDRRIIVLEVDNNERYPQAEAIKLEVLINPEIINYSDETQSGWEGCLSVPGLRGKVSRASTITYKAADLTGNIISRTVNGFHARIIQHEIDHLNGILYPERIDDFKSFGYEDTLPEFQ